MESQFPHFSSLSWSFPDLFQSTWIRSTKIKTQAHFLPCLVNQLLKLFNWIVRPAKRKRKNSLWLYIWVHTVYMYICMYIKYKCIYTKLSFYLSSIFFSKKKECPQSEHSIKTALTPSVGLHFTSLKTKEPFNWEWTPYFHKLLMSMCSTRYLSHQHQSFSTWPRQRAPPVQRC